MEQEAPPSPRSILAAVEERRKRQREWKRVDTGELKTLEDVEREHIARVLERTKGNIQHSSEVLGIDRRTLYRKLNQYAREAAEVPGEGASDDTAADR